MGSGDGIGRPRCRETGLSVPECSCRACLEAMLREVQPTLLVEEIKIARMSRDRDEPGASEFREAA